MVVSLWRYHSPSSPEGITTHSASVITQKIATRREDDARIWRLSTHTHRQGKPNMADTGAEHCGRGDNDVTPDRSPRPWRCYFLPVPSTTFFTKPDIRHVPSVATFLSLQYQAFLIAPRFISNTWSVLFFIYILKQYNYLYSFACHHLTASFKWNVINFQVSKLLRASHQGQT